MRAFFIFCFLLYKKVNGYLLDFFQSFVLQCRHMHKGDKTAYANL